MSLNTKDFNTVVSDQVATIQSQNAGLSNFNPGTVLRAVLEAVAGVVMFLQSLIVAMYAYARASTSTGADLDSWMADFGLTRLPAVAATGQAVFSRYTATLATQVPVGTTIESSDGTLIFTVIADTSNVNYVANQNAYPLASGTSSVSVTVQATVAGSAGNATANAINTLTSAITGVDTVTNPSAFTNGTDAETDAAFRTRFQNYLASLGEGTPTAISNAIDSLQSNVTNSITENEQFPGTADNGYFYAVVDDGSGAPPSSLITSASAAVNSARACGVRYGVFGPSVLTADVAMSVTTAAGYTHANVVAAVVTALTDYVNALGVGVTLPYTILASIAYGVAGVINVSGVTLNASNVDLVPTAKQVIKVGTVTVT